MSSSALVASPPLTLQTLPSGRSEAWCLRGYITFHALYALAEIGFMREIADGPVDVYEFAERTGGDAAALMAVARYLDGIGLFWHDSVGRFYLDAEVSELDLATIEMFYAYDAMFRDLAPLLRGSRRYGVDFERDARLDVRATAAMCRGFSYPALIAEIRQRAPRLVVDLGCGSAEVLIALCREDPELRGIGVDISSAAVAHARMRVAEESLGDRIDIVMGDITALDTVLPRAVREEADLLFSAAVFHEFAFDGAGPLTRVLRSVHDAFPRRHLLLSEALEQSDEELRRNPTSVLEHHLFHRLSRQGIATDTAWLPAFAHAGYALESRVPIGKTAAIFVLAPEES